jgi:CTP:molybdopterin cytidylyltransferase MocA
VDIYEESLRLKREGRPSAIATIVQCVGSSPQKEGAKMLVRDDGSILGTLGGGCIEAEVIQASRQAMKDGRPLTIPFELTERQLKQLLPLGNKPVIRHCLDNLVAAGIKDIVVVLSQRESEILNSVKDLPVKIVFNENPESEMAESVRIGLRTLTDSSPGVLVHLSDYPLVSAATLESIIQCYFETPDKIIVPLYKGKRGHPGLLPMPVINEAFEGLNLRDIINRDSGRIRFLDVDDEGVILDMDTKTDEITLILSSHLISFLP